MARIDVLMPQMGESIAEGTLSKWLKKLGDEVKRDEPLFERSTDKVDAEIPAPNAGVLAEIKVQEGQTVPVQTLVAVIETDKGGAPPPTHPPHPHPLRRPAPSSCRTTRPASLVPRLPSSERGRCRNRGRAVAPQVYSARAQDRRGASGRYHDDS